MDKVYYKRYRSRLLASLRRPAALILVLTTGCEIKPGGDAVPPPDMQSRGPGLSAHSPSAPAARFLAGAEGEFSLDAYKGRPLLIAVLGAGTHEIGRVVKGLNQAYEEHQSSGLAVVGLLAALDPEEDPAHIATGLGAIFPIATAPPSMLAALGSPRALPTYIFVDGRSAVRKQIPGAVEWDEFRAHVRDLVADAR